MIKQVLFLRVGIAKEVLKSDCSTIFKVVSCMIKLKANKKHFFNDKLIRLKTAYFEFVDGLVTFNNHLFKL
jgi:hypothetical protein